MRFSLVMKIGGAGLANGACVLRACKLVLEHLDSSPILVVSAHEGVTTQLETCALEAAQGQLNLEALRIRHKSLLCELGLDPELLDRLLRELGQVLYSISERRRILPEEMDFVLSFGERMSARIVAASLQAQGIGAAPVDAYDLGLTTDSCHGHARPLPGMETSLQRSLEQIHGLPVVTGFLAKDGRGNLTTLGRNGSDLTAALVARAVGAKRLIFWKCVPGVLDADPCLIPEASVLPGLSMQEAAALAFHGAAVLHPSTLLPLLGSPVAVEVRDVRDPQAPGTRFDQRDVSSRPIAIASMSELVGLRVQNELDAMSATLFTLLHAHHVRPHLLHVAPEGITVYAAPCPGLEILQRELSDRAVRLPALASVALIGGAQDGAGPRALKLLRAENMEPVRTQLDPNGVCQLFLIEPQGRANAVQLLHKQFLAEPSRGRVYR